MTFSQDFARALECDKDKEIRRRIMREFMPALPLFFLLGVGFGWLL